MAKTVAGETLRQNYELQQKFNEFQRQINQNNGYPFDFEKLITHLQNGVEGKFDVNSSKLEKVTPIVDDCFELIFESAHITIPDMETATRYAKEKWSKEVGSVTPSMSFTTGDKKKIKVFRFKQQLSSQKCVDFIKSQNAILPNVYGLAIAEMSVGSQLPKDKYMLGFDNRDSLSVSSGGSHGVPRLYLYSDGSVCRDRDSWGGGWGVVCCLVLFCD
ncbi:MAG: hypothetical protein WC795_02805 [Candidatus Paceibacterota bacterium]|jgi:hypothetical protein